MSNPRTNTKIATLSWALLGPGPIAVSPTSKNVLIAIADTAPATGVGFTLSPGKVLDYTGTSRVWIKLRMAGGGAVTYAGARAYEIEAHGELKMISRVGPVIT
jgi:hypothetical protein